MNFHFLPAAWADERGALAYESYVIKALQAPNQQNHHQCSDIRVDNFCLWPRFRTKPSLMKELELNLYCRLQHPYGFDLSFFGDGRHCESSRHLVQYLCANFGLWSENVKAVMYSLECATWLAVFLGEKQTHLEYQRVWDSGHAIQLMLGFGTFLCASTPRAAWVQRKTFRFLSTSGKLSTRRHRIYVPTHSEFIVR